MRLCCCLVLFGLWMNAQEGMPMRTAQAEYKATAQVGAVTFAASFEGRSVPAKPSSFVMQQWVLVELAVYPGKEKEFEFRAEHFALRFNGNKAYRAQEPSFVAGYIPGGWSPGDGRRPVQQEQEDPNAPPLLTPAQWVRKLGWADGRVSKPAAGLLYFSYEGNMGKLKSIELLYAGPEGKATLPLR